MTPSKKKILEKIEIVGSFISKDGDTILLNDFLTSSDYWVLDKRKSKVTILTHNAIKKIAMKAGIFVLDYVILTQPDVYNNFQYTIQVKITDEKGRTTIEIGESNRSNLGQRGRQNPANMAQKRALDRAVLSHLGIVGLLSEEELEDNNETAVVDKLTPDESKVIAPEINVIFAAKNKADLVKFNNQMKKDKVKYNPNQLNVLRGLWKKKLSDLTKSF